MNSYIYFFLIAMRILRTNLHFICVVFYNCEMREEDSAETQFLFLYFLWRRSWRVKKSTNILDFVSVRKISEGLVYILYVIFVYIMFSS